MYARWLTSCVMVLLLASCGGGGGDSTNTAGNSPPPADSSGGGGNPPASPPSSGPIGGGDNPPTGGGGGDGSTPPPPPQEFTAQVTQAPADGERLSGTVLLEVRGSGMRNVELLPENGYVPKLADLQISDDGTLATLQLDTRVITNGGIKLRIVAFDQPAGMAGAREVVAMPSRTWLVSNPEQPQGSPEGRAIACMGVGLSYTPLDDSLPVVCIQWTPPSPPIPPEQCTAGFGTPYVRPGDGLPVYRNGNLMSKLNCIPEANNGRVNEGCFCRG